MCFLFGAMLLSACAKKDAAPVQASKAPEPLAIQMKAAEVRRVDRTLSVTGELVADEAVAMRFEVGGRIQSVQADFGQFVRKGHVLAELDPTEYRIQLERAKAMLAQALARVGLTPAEADRVPATSPAIRQAEAQLADAKSKYEAAAKLIRTGDIAQERFNELEKAMQARQAAVDAARDELKVLTANIESLKAEVRLAEKRLGDTVIRAPFDAAVTERLVSPGQFFKDMENAPVMRLVKADPLRLRLEVPESEAAAVKVGSTLTYTTDSQPGKVFTAVIRETNPSLKQNSRTLTAEARISNADRSLRPGSFVQVRLTTARDVEIVTVPKQAIYTVAGLSKVFSVRDGKAIEHRIPPGMEGDTWAAVPAGMLQPGDPVAVSGLAALVDQMPVRSR
jgi:RND family efflux transporter MFP subunit